MSTNYPKILILLMLSLSSATFVGFNSALSENNHAASSINSSPKTPSSTPTASTSAVGKAVLTGTTDVKSLTSARRYSGPLPNQSPLKLTVVGPGPKISSALLSSNAESSPPDGKQSLGQPLTSQNASISSVSSSSVTIATTFDGLNQIGSCDCFPPDVTLAAGPTSIVEMVNLAGAVYTKQGTLVKSFLLFQFFNTGYDFISDPKVLYDAPSGRWFASLIDTTRGLSPSNLTIAVSTTSDPTGVWKIYTLNVGNILPDQPIIGVNDDKFVISANDFKLVGNSFSYIGAQYWVLNKLELLAGLPVIDLATFGPDPTLISAHPSQSLSSTSIEYMVSNAASSGNFINNQVMIFSLSGVPPGIVTPNAVALKIAAIGTFANGTIPGGYQPGTNVTINTDDQRIEDAAWFQGKLWFSLNDGCKPTGENQLRACFRLTQVDTTTVQIIQQFDVGAKGQYYFYPALRMDSSGNLLIVYGYSSSAVVGGSNIYPSLAATGQAITDPANTISPPQTLVIGSTNVVTGRYGDYFGAGVDPSNPSIVWVGGEYHTTATGPRYFDSGGAFSNWSTFVGGVRIKTSDSPGIPVTVSDVAVSTGPRTLTVGVGSQSTAAVALVSVNYAGTVNLTVSVSSGLTNRPTASMSPAGITLASGGSGVSTLVISSSSSTFSGLYSVTLTATTVSASHSVSYSLIVTPVLFRVNNLATFTGMNVNTSGIVSVDSSSTTGYTASGSINVVATNSTTGTQLYSHTYPVTGRPFLQANSTSPFCYPCLQTVFLLNVGVSPYPLSSNIALTVNEQGTLGVPSVSVTVSRNVDIDGNGLVDTADGNAISVAFGCKIGKSCYNPIADLDADGTINSADQAIFNNYFGSSNLIPTFKLSSPGSILSFTAGSPSSFILTVTSLNNLAGTVGLTAAFVPILANGPSAALSPVSVSLTSGSNATSTVTVSALSSTPVGMYVLNLAGTGASRTNTIFLAVAVGPISMSVNSESGLSGVDLLMNGTVTVDQVFSSTTLTVSGSMTVTASNLTTRAQIFANTYPIKGVPMREYGAFVPGTSNKQPFQFIQAILFDVPVAPYPVAGEVIVAVFGPTSTNLTSTYINTSNVRNPDINLDGVFDPGDFYRVVNAIGCKIGTPCYDPRADLAASGSIGFIDLSIISLLITSPDLIPDFSMSASSTLLTNTRPSTSTSTLTMSSQNGVGGTISLSATVSPNVQSGPSVTLSPMSPVLQSGGSVSSTLTVSAQSSTPLGFYTVNVTGTIGILSHSIIVTVVVTPAFSMTINPATMNMIRPMGGLLTQFSTLTITSYGFNGQITISNSPNFSSPLDGPVIGYSQATLTMSPGQTTSVTVSVSICSATPNPPVYTISGTSNVFTNSVQLTVNVTGARGSGSCPI